MAGYFVRFECQCTLAMAMHKWILCCGGSGMHSFFAACVEQKTRATMQVVVPVTDDGGSSLAIVEAFGGPSVGDLRNVMLAIASAVWTEAVRRHALPQAESMVQRLRFLRRRLEGPDPRAELAELIAQDESFSPTQRDALDRLRRYCQPSSVYHRCNLENASVGNLLLFTLIADAVADETVEGPVRAACATFLTTLCGLTADVMSTVCADLRISVVPALDLIRSGPSVPLVGQTARLPTVSLQAVLDGGERLLGQRVISYGPQSLHTGYHVHKDTLCDPLRSSVDSLMIVAGSTTTLTYAASPLVITDSTVLIIGRGSLLTSSLAAVSAVRTQLKVRDVFLLINSTRDRETSFLGTTVDYISFVRRIVGTDLRYVGVVAANSHFDCGVDDTCVKVRAIPGGAFCDGALVQCLQELTVRTS